MQISTGFLGYAAAFAVLATFLLRRLVRLLDVPGRDTCPDGCGCLCRLPMSPR